MNVAFALLLLLVAVFGARTFLMSFRAQRPADYADTGPDFVLARHLSGPILSEGVVYGPRGRVTSRFVAQMHGAWDGSSGTMTEAFTYSNGRQHDRRWILEMGPDNTFTARADDLAGPGRGVISGATVMLRYRIVLPKESGGHVLDVTDWMYLMENGAIMNRSEMRKFGVKVAELVATMRPVPETPS